LGAIIPLTLGTLLGLRGVFSLVTGFGATALLVWLAKSRIGGVTGDVFGMIVEIVETGVVLVFLVGA